MPMLSNPHESSGKAWLSVYHQLSDWIRANPRGEAALTAHELAIWRSLCARYDAQTVEFDKYEWARLQYYRWLYQHGLLNEG